MRTSRFLILLMIAIAGPSAADPLPTAADDVTGPVRSLATDRGRIFAVIQPAGGGSVIRALDNMPGRQRGAGTGSSNVFSENADAGNCAQGCPDRAHKMP